MTWDDAIQDAEKAGMEDSLNHLSYGKSIESLDVVVIDESRAMQAITRTILQPMRLRRMRFFDNAEHALRDIQEDPPNLVIADWRMRSMPGPRLLKTLRSKQSGLMAVSAVLLTISGPTRREVEQAYRAGAHAVIAKPFSPNAMQRRIQWILQDARLMTLVGESYIIEGVKEALDEQQEASTSENTYTDKMDSALQAPESASAVA